MELTVVFVVGSIVCSQLPSDKCRGWLAVTHLAFTACLFLHFVVMLVYWGMIHKKAIGDFDGLGRVHMYTVHIVPAIAFAMNWAATDVVLFQGHRVGLTALSVLYCALNCYETLKTGKPLYWFLTWQDIWSPLICAMIIGCVNLVHGAFVQVSALVKPQMNIKTV